MEIIEGIHMVNTHGLQMDEVIYLPDGEQYF